MAESHRVEGVAREGVLGAHAVSSHDVDTRQGSRERLHRSSEKRISRAFAFWLVAVAAGTFTAASAAPSPLYPVYQAEYKFSAITLTIIFAVYVFALVMSLLTVGKLSDYSGRRIVLVSALFVEAGSMVLFIAADGVPVLVAARVVQGFATGAALGVVSAYLLDLQPTDGSRLGSLINTVSTTFGLGVGAVVTGLLVEYGPQPTRLIFVLLCGLFVVLIPVTLFLPETVTRSPGGVAALRPQIAVPPRARLAFVGAVPTMIATWALGGLILSDGGSLLGTVFAQTNDAVIGVVIGLFPIFAATSATVARNVPPATMARAGMLLLLAGTCVFLVAVWSSSLGLFFASAVVAGSGFGSGFLGSLRAVSQLAEAHQRAALLSAVFVVSYLAFSIPALLAGVLITDIGIRTTAYSYGGFVALVALVSIGLARYLAAPGN